MTFGPDRAEKQRAKTLILDAPYRASALVSLLQLHWFIRLRWTIILAVLAVLVVERFLLPDGTTRPWAVANTMLALCGINIVWMIFSHYLVRISRVIDEDDAGADAETDARSASQALIFANTQVAVDLFVLTLLLRYSGGIENPMAFFYLFHMAIGALLLKPWHAALQGAWAVLLFTALGLGELWGWITPHYELLPQEAPVGLYQHTAFVLITLSVLACAVLGTLSLMLQIAGRIRRRDAQLRRVNLALRQSQTAIEDLQKRRSRFMQTAAHQLKSPLATIQTLVGLIYDGVVPPDALKKTCGRVIQRCRDGIGQVTELLTYARMQEADPRRHHRAVSDVGEEVEYICQCHAPLAEEKGLDFAYYVPREVDLRVRVDKTDLRNCIANLVDNAIKYTPREGKVNVTVERSGVREVQNGWTEVLRGGPPDALGDFVIVHVADTGVGIDSASLKCAEGGSAADSIFDAFRRGNEALSIGVPGTGLGLAIVREIVEQASGRIRVHSRPGHGSTFTVAFPVLGAGVELVSIRDTRSSEFCIQDVRGEPRSTVPGSEDSPHAG